jgi:DNA-binding transcriptional MerR regulator
MEYKVSELAEKAGVTKRTIHYYISKGLLLPPDGNGVNSLYNDKHLERLLLIKKLQSEYRPLNKIREYILEDHNEKQPDLTITKDPEKEIYIKENICNIFEIHYSQENGEKYKHIIENVKKYVEKMMED